MKKVKDLFSSYRNQSLDLQWNVVEWVLSDGSSSFDRLQFGVAYLYPLKTSENLKVS